MSGDPYIKENEWLEDEIARLETGREALLETNRWQAGEIERLRAALERLDRQRQIAERDGSPVPHWAIVEACQEGK